MASHGPAWLASEFDPALESWSSYVEQLEFYFTTSMTRAILFTDCSPSTFELLRSLIQPDKPSDKMYAQW